jgi:hypothetical protein
MTTSYGRTIAIKIEVAWDGTNYVDESGYVANASGQIRLNAPFTNLLANRSTIDQAIVVLNNFDNRYSSLLSTSSLYAYTAGGIAYHIPMTVKVSIDGGSYTTIFTGTIKTYSEEVVSINEASQISFDCRSREEDYINTKISTTRDDFTDSHDDGETEKEILSRWLTSVGYDVGDADLDDGLFVIPWAALDKESAIEQSWDLAAACGGRFFMRHSDGAFVYQNMQHWATLTSVATYTENDYSRLKISYNDQDLYSEIEVNVYDHAEESEDTLFSLDTTLTVNPTETIEYVAELDKPLYGADTFDYTASSPGGANLTASVDVVEEVFAHHVKFTITNNDTIRVAVIRLLTVDGVGISTDSTKSEKTTSVDALWSRVSLRTRTLDNRYIQSNGQAKGVSAFVGNASETPLTILHLQNVLGDPSRLVGDMITISNTRALSSSVRAIITSIGWRFDTAGFLYTIEAVESTQLFPYGLSSPSYFVLGTSKWGTSDPARGRLFF